MPIQSSGADTPLSGLSSHATYESVDVSANLSGNLNHGNQSNASAVWHQPAPATQITTSLQPDNNYAFQPYQGLFVVGLVFFNCGVSSDGAVEIEKVWSCNE